MHTNGRGTLRVTPSTVTDSSSMTSSRADWVFALVRLISSPSKRLQFAAPQVKRNACASRSYMEKPVMSEGMVSGVNCTRLHSRSSALDSASASVVLPVPGTSSSRMWPPA